MIVPTCVVLSDDGRFSETYRRSSAGGYVSGFCVAADASIDLASSADACYVGIDDVCPAEAGKPGMPPMMKFRFRLLESQGKSTRHAMW